MEGVEGWDKIMGLKAIVDSSEDGDPSEMLGKWLDDYGNTLTDEQKAYINDVMNAPIPKTFDAVTYLINSMQLTPEMMEVIKSCHKQEGVEWSFYGRIAQDEQKAAGLRAEIEESQRFLDGYAALYDTPNAGYYANDGESTLDFIIRVEKQYDGNDFKLYSPEFNPENVGIYFEDEEETQDFSPYNAKKRMFVQAKRDSDSQKEAMRFQKDPYGYMYDAVNK